MQICCTKKLLDEMGIDAQNGRSENDLFCWSAHFITLNRRKTIVVVNDSSRFGFILYGLKAKDFNGLNKLILQGISICLQDEKIKEEIIEQYLKEAGDFVFTKTRGPKYVARLNKACEQVAIFEDTLETNELYQVIASRNMNDELIKINKESEYDYPHVLLRKDLEQCYGEPIIRCVATDLMIKLNLGSYSAWRRIITPEDINFKQLHKIIQVVYDWKGYHLYDFSIFGKSGNCLINIKSEFEEVCEPRTDCQMNLDSDVRLSDYVRRQCNIVYLYDYGDNWEHKITIQGINTEYDKNHPTCLMGEGNAPPEDVGGVGGYEEFLEIMSNPSHTEYKNMKQWVRSQWYKDFDIDFVNRRLQNILRK
jgi:hypothetical protein